MPSTSPNVHQEHTSNQEKNARLGFGSWFACYGHESEIVRKGQEVIEFDLAVCNKTSLRPAPSVLAEVRRKGEEVR